MNRDHSVVFEIASKYCIWTLLLTTKKQESSRKMSTSALLTMPKPLTTWITINSGKSLKRWEYQTTWPASWEICMQVRKQQLELDMEQDWFQIWKGVCQGCILSPCLFTSMQSTSCEMLGWMKHKLESRLPGEISITSDMQTIYTLDELLSQFGTSPLFHVWF